jgi:hypothetical protein
MSIQDESISEYDSEAAVIDDFRLSFHSGGETAQNFTALFDVESLKQALFKIIKTNKWYCIRVHGEGYGGKQQKMADTYGPNLKFIVFDVKINNKNFLDIAQSEIIAKELGLDFVHYEIGDCTPEWFDAQTKMHSIQAIRNGMGEGKLREGIIARPIQETLNEINRRVIYKHKNPEFWEMASERPLGEKLVVMSDMYKITNEWVTKQRAEHVIQHIIEKREHKEIVFNDIKEFVKDMIEDVKREAAQEIIWSDAVEKQIRKHSGLLFNSIVPPINNKKRNKKQINSDNLSL